MYTGYALFVGRKRERTYTFRLEEITAPILKYCLPSSLHLQLGLRYSNNEVNEQEGAVEYITLMSVELVLSKNLLHYNALLEFFG